MLPWEIDLLLALTTKTALIHSDQVQIYSHINTVCFLKGTYNFALNGYYSCTVNCMPNVYNSKCNFFIDAQLRNAVFSMKIFCDIMEDVINLM